MTVVVQKYGGSSVADVDRVRGVAQRVAATRAAGKSVAVVVSAMGNTTNELLARAHQVSAHPDRRELDMLVSVGERITMSLLAMALWDQGVPARSLTGSQSGIITDESHADARVVEVRPDRVRKVLEEGYVAIVAGFQGVSRTREVTTLGRGGSDTTAVVLAAALDAAYCEICSDVDGVYSSDPRVVPEAVKLDELSLEQALSLSRGGAKVLHEEAVRYARDQGIAIRAASTFGPGSGTVLKVEEPEHPVAAVTGDDQLVRVELLRHEAEQIERIRERGGQVRRRVGDVLLVDVRNAHGGLSGLPGVGGPTAVVTAVSSALGEDLLRQLRVERALDARQVERRLSGSGGDVVWWEVPPPMLGEAVRVTHRVLVGADQ